MVTCVRVLLGKAVSYSRPNLVMSLFLCMLNITTPGQIPFLLSCFKLWVFLPAVLIERTYLLNLQE